MDQKMSYKGNIMQPRGAEGPNKPSESTTSIPLFPLYTQSNKVTVHCVNTAMIQGFLELALTSWDCIKYLRFSF